MTESLDKKTHEWEGLSEYKMDGEDIFNFTEGELEGKYEILKKMNKNQYTVVASLSNETKDIVNEFNKIVNGLKDYGLDIGKGNSEYGYKMPLPNKKEDRRRLIVFKRK